MSNLLHDLLASCVAKIEVKSRITAMLEASEEYLTGDQNTKLIMWTDGSYHKQRGYGLAVVWKENPGDITWSHQVFLLDRSFDNNMAEFFAFYKAMQIAQRRCERDLHISRVVIYTDSQFVLDKLKNHHTLPSHKRSKFPRQIELAQMKAVARELDESGIEVIFRWVPGHSNVPGNVKADQSAGQISKPPFPLQARELLVPSSDGRIEPLSKKVLKFPTVTKALRIPRAPKVSKIRKSRIHEKRVCSKYIQYLRTEDIAVP